MFFIGIFGMGNRSEPLRGGISAVCPGCGKQVSFTLNVTYDYLSFFFFPILKFHRQYYVVCPGCGSLFQVENQAARAVASGRSNTLSAADLILLRRQTQESTPFCPACGARNPAGSSFCCRCGQKLL
jgi:hypothetical protein